MRYLILSVMIALNFVSSPHAQSQATAADKTRLQQLLDDVDQAYRQSRYSSSFVMADEAYKFASETFGKTDLNTLNVLNKIALMHDRLGGYGYDPRQHNAQAERLYKQVLQHRREILGQSHTDTLATLSNLAHLHVEQRNIGEAEKSFVELLQIRREALGMHHNKTRRDLETLARFYLDEGQYNKAESLFHEAMKLSASILGVAHPKSLDLQFDYAQTLINTGQILTAVDELRRSEPHRFVLVDAFNYNDRSEKIRSRWVADQHLSFRNIVLTLGANYRNQHAVELAAKVMLRWRKGAQRQEHTYLAQLMEDDDESKIKALIQEVASARKTLAHRVKDRPMLSYLLENDPTPLLEELEAKQLALAQANDTYNRYLNVGRADSTDVVAVLPRNTAVLIFQQYERYNLEQDATYGSSPLAGLLISKSGKTLMKDVANSHELEREIQDFYSATDQFQMEQIAHSLNAQLFDPFSSEIQKVETLYVASDAFELTRLPLARLSRYLDYVQNFQPIGTPQALFSAALEVAVPKPQ